MYWKEEETHLEKVCNDCELPIDFGNGVYCSGRGCEGITHPQCGTEIKNGFLCSNCS